MANRKTHCVIIKYFKSFFFFLIKTERVYGSVMMVALKSRDHGVVCLWPKLNFFYVSGKCSFMKIIIMNTTGKNYKLLLVAELIFCNNLKLSENILVGFCQGNQRDVFQVDLQKYIILAKTHKRRYFEKWTSVFIILFIYLLFWSIHWKSLFDFTVFFKVSSFVFDLEWVNDRI